MMANTTLSIRIDEDVKKEADLLFSELGMNISSAVNIFLRQAIREQSIPFKVGLDDNGYILYKAEAFVDEHIDAFKALAE